jgi:hypothetical protein
MPVVTVHSFKKFYFFEFHFFFLKKYFFFPFDGRARVAGLCPALREEVGLYISFFFL